ncbi:hypothetical protein NEMBOFW57_003747 [Staphylotrichum longicolle]|uniref:Uncharacterized protein n=1 Tax=Staphylotrichum longicolle TaxID=669026 RepID=A0AAD4F645_9PEZI|nr:hypothetical protein NEMBOFW57_003747 [Staphylotrichum longicolle]
MADLARHGLDPATSLQHPDAPVPPSLAQSIHCFPTADRLGPRRSRARFTDEEREKVLSSAVRGAERKVLSFCYCVRTRFADVNIFDSSSRADAADAAATMRTETLMRTMSTLLTRIATPAKFSLTSNPTAFNNTMVSWLTDPDFHLPNGSIVGLCCSSLLGLEFQEEAATGTDGLITDFRRFLLATSLAHAGWRDGGNAIKALDLCAAGQISGCSLIKRLDRILTPQFLARCGRESCQVLFLLVLGAVLGVGYSSSQMEQHSPEFPSAEMLSPEFQRSPTLWLAMKEHLCQMLAHHLIFVGSMLGIKLDTGLEQRIIETAVSRWNKAEEFVWADAAGLAGYPIQPSLDQTEASRPVKNENDDEEGVSGADDREAENPKSYLAMFDEPESFESAGPQNPHARSGSIKNDP